MIRFESVTKRYPDGTVAVDELSLEIPDRSITVLVGPSGCGKTTSLRMINRMIEPSGGRILLDGTDIADQPVHALRRSMGYVIQHAGLFPHRTVADNIATVPRLLGWDRRRARSRALELMERVGLDPALAKRYPYQLSGGQQQRVGVARALAADPPVLLMDEPFSAVDPIVRKGLQEELLRIQEELGKTIVFVTHDIDEAIRLGDLVAVLRTGGRLAQFAPPDRLLSAPADGFVEDFLGADRGIRRLSFFASSGLELTTAPVVTENAGNAGNAGNGKPADPGGAPYLLVTDAEGRPLGWTDPGRQAPGDRTLIPYGRPFEPGRDSLRTALDCAVLSPIGWAVGVDADGRVVGVASQEAVAAAIRAAHAGHGMVSAEVG
ncbi:ABC transporter ATP-binding protein [Peterkaempfera bronchialis]|uniref:ABC-type quaternary amine transporter n=1 Tax=Peterkaempfera bronchialis TaxID=2126346 RepID=A0A345T443_9ACTN|nr:ABC transporter ATP-binding protein [Peterkaempfera bronchialis]AXI80748.1 ABC transporter ATP-binding protein [Peterkaempfera bronchialis]